MKDKFVGMFEDRSFPDKHLCDGMMKPDNDDISALLKILTDESLLYHESAYFFPYHAAHILSYFKVDEAVPGLIRLLDNSSYEEIPDYAKILSYHSERITDVLVELYPMGSSSDKDNYALVLSESGVKNDKIYSVFIEHLKFGSDLSAIYLSEYGDPKAIAPLSQKFDELKIDSENILGNQLFIEIDAAITSLGGSLSPEQKKKLQRAKKQSKIFSNQFLQRIDKTVDRAFGKKTGRNDPCSCGSGKKYKKCCLDAEHGIPF